MLAFCRYSLIESRQLIAPVRSGFIARVTPSPSADFCRPVRVNCSTLSLHRPPMAAVWSEPVPGAGPLIPLWTSTFTAHHSRLDGSDAL